MKMMLPIHPISWPIPQVLITDAGVVKLVAKCKAITSINLMECNAVTDVALEAIAVSLKGQLEWLDVCCTKAVSPPPKPAQPTP